MSGGHGRQGGGREKAAEPSPAGRAASPAPAACRPVAGRPLAAAADASRLFQAWLEGTGGLPGARAEWARYLGGGGPERAAPAWAAAAWRDPWLADLLADLPDEPARRRCEADVRSLAAGAADVVVTGQQPGFLGGPLYTLYKVASVVAAARARSAAGRPTVPLFWSGDDDDDWQEAFAPRLWDPARRAFLAGEAPSGAADRMIGAAPAAAWGRGEAAWLRERSARQPLAGELAELWEKARRGGGPWDRLQRRALLRLFGRDGLLVVSGRDAALHAVAAPFYAELWRRRAELAAAVAARGEALAAAGWHAQIGPASLARPFHVEEEGRRLALPGDAQELPPPATLRPGVVLRSPVQDWLFRPAAVVVGPAETAYLLQLEAAYRLLALPRAPLLPRLFATLAPGDAVAALAGEAKGAPQAATPAPDWAAQAERVVAPALAALAEALREAAGGDDDAGAAAAQRLAGAWRRQVAALLEKRAGATAAAGATGGLRRGGSGSAGAEAAGQDVAADAAPGRPELAPWVQPAGRRQERALATHWATALWGEPLVAAVAEAAAAHFRDGGAGGWREWIVTVPDPDRAGA